MSSEKRNPPTVGERLADLAGTMLEDKKWSGRLAKLSGCLILLLTIPTVCGGACLLLTVAKTEAWAIWIGLGVVLGVVGTLLVQYLRRRRRLRRVAPADAEGGEA